MIPTITERESNARRVAALGAGEVVLPVTGDDGEKRIDGNEFSDKLKQVLTDPGYRESAWRVADSMRQYGGVKAAADRIEQLAKASGR
jgi:UDP:flavonoid glycosyltransferase YjiC (YdhE family)